MRRGIVSNPFYMSFNTERAHLVFHDRLSILDIHYFCFYWDDIVILNSENLQMGMWKEKELNENGAIRRPTMALHPHALRGEDFGPLYTKFQIETLDSLRENEKGTHWHIHQFGNKIDYGNEEKVKLQLRLELLDALRIPGEDVHIEDILRFRDDCKDDLNALHEYLDKLYFEVLDSKDFNLQRAKNYSLLSEAIKNLDKSVGGKWRNPFRMGVKLDTEVDGGQIIDFLTPLYHGAIAGSMGGVIPGMLATVATAVPSFLKLQPKWIGVRDKGPKELAYMTKAIQKGVLQRK